jgi:hypothetical protein
MRFILAVAVMYLFFRYVIPSLFQYVVAPLVLFAAVILIVRRYKDG